MRVRQRSDLRNLTRCNSLTCPVACGQVPVCGKTKQYVSRVADERPEWATWLQDQFERHRTIRRPVDLAKASGTKPNGRPRIDDSRISSWLKGQRPSYELAMVAAEAFGRPISEALTAAGYRMEPEHRGELVVPDVHYPREEIRYQRPEGISAHEWEVRKRAAEATLRGLFEEYET